MWTLAEDRSIYVVEHVDGAGSCVVTIFLDDLDARVAAIAGRGVQPVNAEEHLGALNERRASRAERGSDPKT